MALLDLASGDSVWRGVDYYNNHEVKTWELTGPDSYDGTVQGTELYSVHIDLEHPRRSTCTCPFTAGRRVICKHMVALYFKVVPGSYETFMDEVHQWEAEDQKRAQQHRKDLEKYVKSLTKAELQQQLLALLIEREERHFW